MYSERDEEQLRLIQKFVPDATPEKLRVFQDCMQTDAVFKAALPYGILGALGTAMLLPKKLGMAKPMIALIVGTTSYVVGKITYAPTCSIKAFGTANLEPRPGTRRNRFPPTTDRANDFGQPDIPKYSGTDNFLQEERSWDNLESPFENETYAFDDTGNYTQAEAVNKERKNEKKRVTYDDLWMQHREDRAKDHKHAIAKVYTDVFETEKEMQKVSPDELENPDVEMGERSPWN